MGLTPTLLSGPMTENNQTLFKCNSNSRAKRNINRMRTYQPIWERIRANPGVRVPIEVPAVYLSRLLKAVNREKDQDSTYRNVRTSQRKTGIMYKSTAPHTSREGYIVCTFILREYDVILSYKDKQGVKRVEPPLPEVLARELDMVAFDFVPAVADVIAAKMQLGTEIQAAQATKEY